MKKEMNNHFKMWFKEEHEGSALPKTKALYDYFDKMLKLKYTNNGYINMKFKKDITPSKGEQMDEKPNDLDG
jgi:hypothetical protein